MNLKSFVICILIFGICYAKAIACSCGISFSESFRSSDFVGHIKFKNIYKSAKYDPYYKVDIEIIEKFKGPEISSIWIDNEELCRFEEIYPGEELVIFSTIDPLNNYSIHYCSMSFPPNSKNWSIEVEILKKLKYLKLEYVQDFNYEFENSFFNEVWGIDIDLPEKDFAIYEVTYDRLNFFIDVKIIESFGDKTDEKVEFLLKQSDWYFYHYYGDFSPQLFRYLIILNKEDWRGRSVTKFNYL